ncbi:MAG: hypothetical protein OEW96_07780 [Betaproteobacteria bacterium]|nr:hypothetical protein [Betaproteobacteria bacterium]MDH5211559.1 hypothetical protein [Betaproteobacteria bacterium]
MKLNVTALTLTAGLFWGGALLIVALSNLAWPGYGRAFLELGASLYPGYHPGAGFGSVVTGTLYALVDGSIAGFLFGWIYNLLAGARRGAAT